MKELEVKRLEEIDNAKPSDVLEDFRIIKLKTISAGYNYGYKVWDKIEKALQQAEKDKKLLEILKLCGNTKSDELQIYLSNRTDGDIGNGVPECEAFKIVKEWLENGTNKKH